MMEGILLMADDYSEGQGLLVCAGWVAGLYQAVYRAVWR